VAIASLRHERSAINPGSEFANVELVPDVLPETPSETDTPVPTQPVPAPEFVEPQEPRPNPKKQPLIPIRIPGQTPIGLTLSAKASAFYAPRPEYPYEARSRHLTGSGIAVLVIDPVTGIVDQAGMAQSIGSPILDNSAISAFKRWRFKKGTVRRIQIPITFDLTGARY
jgi:TonB family protein